MTTNAACEGDREELSSEPTQYDNQRSENGDEFAVSDLPRTVQRAPRESVVVSRTKRGFIDLPSPTPRQSFRAVNIIENKHRRAIIQCEGTIVNNDKTALHCRATRRIAPVPRLLVARLARIADPCGSTDSEFIHAKILLVIVPVAMTIVSVMTRFASFGDKMIAAVLVRITGAKI